METGNKSITWTLLFFVLACLLSYYFFNERISLFPSYLHAWSQSDRYALALGFLNNGFDFFHPQTFNLKTVNGITQVDFPIHEYIIALLMRVTGNHEPLLFRLYILTYCIIGLYFLFRLTRLFGGTVLHGLFTAFFVLSAPVFLFYADGFIPSIPSFANFIIGCYYFFSYEKTRRKKHFAVSIFFFTLAALCRLPYLIFLVAVIGSRFSKIQRNIYEIKYFAFAFTFLAGYYLYNIHLKNIYGTQFLMQLLPPDNFEQLKDLLTKMYSWLGRVYFSPAQYIAIGVITIFAIRLNKNEVHTIASVRPFLLFSLVGVIAYFLLMLKQFPYHDYYFIDSFYPVMAVWLAYEVPKLNFPDTRWNYVSIAAAVTCLFSSAVYAKNILDERDVFHYWNRAEVPRHSFYGSERFLDSLGIPKTAKMLVLDAYTENAELILMNRKGYTVGPERNLIEEGLSKPYDFAVVRNGTVASQIISFDTTIVNRLEKFADNGWISLYRKKNNPLSTVTDFLGIKKENTTYSLYTGFENTSLPAEWSNITRDSIHFFSGTYSLLNNGIENYPALHFTVHEVGILPFSKIFIRGKYFSSDSLDAEVVVSLNNNGKMYYDCRFPLQQQPGSGQWKDFMIQYLIPEVKGKNDEVSVYFTNPERKKYFLDDIAIVIYK